MSMYTNTILTCICGLLFGFLLGYRYVHFLKMKNYHGPDSNEIRKYTYEYKNKFYKFKPIICASINK